MGGFVIIWNLVRTISNDNDLFGFYEMLLCIVLLLSRWDILFGILGKQQYLELSTIAVCLFLISYFRFDKVSQFGTNFHAKALLSFANQIYIMQKNLNVSVLGGKFTMTPLLQSFIC